MAITLCAQTHRWCGEVLTIKACTVMYINVHGGGGGGWACLISLMYAQFTVLKGRVCCLRCYYFSDSKAMYMSLLFSTHLHTPTHTLTELQGVDVFSLWPASFMVSPPHARYLYVRNDLSLPLFLSLSLSIRVS